MCFITCCALLKLRIMATVYKVEVVSDWISYSKDDLEKKLNDAINKEEREKGNTIKVKVIERQ